MKKRLYFITAAALSLVACSRNQEVDVPDANLSLFARTESPADTKTVVESGVHVYWEPGDEIAVFMGEQSAKFTTDITAASGTATFKGTFGDATWPEDLDLWAVYPFSEDAVFDGETITTTLPSEQVAREGSFGKDMNLAIAHSTGTTLQFYNVGGGIRFSVNEEGIKKVMFEGLSGEIISGKVKIGFEGGLPVVKEITGGSQFITLLPPAGQETFEPGAWYYIVAIPGSLESGYKLRFYKDSDYARKVSEKAVEIKRSIFGSLEKADSGIEYEPQATHFPETTEEWKASVALTYSLSNHADELYRQFVNSRDIKDFEKGLQDIEGVLFVSFADDSSSVSLLQKDSVWFNYYFYTQDEGIGIDDYSSSMLINKRPLLSSQMPARTNHIVESGSSLIYAPFQWSFEKPLEEWQNMLSLSFSNVKVLKKDKNVDNAGIIQLKEILSNHYDFIVFDTHGCIGQSIKDYNFISSTFGTKESTLLATSTLYYDNTHDELLALGLTEDDFAIGKAGDNDPNVYVWITPHFLGDSRFDKSCVMLSACSSAKKIEYTDDDDKGSMVGAFINRGASIVTGAKISMKSYALEVMVGKCIEYLSKGLSFQKSFSYLTAKDGKLDSWLHIWYEYRKEHDAFWQNLTYRPCNIPDYYIIETNKTECDPFFFFYPFPSLGEIPPQNENVNLFWDCRLDSFSIKWEYDIVNDSCLEKKYPYNVIFDVYVDGSRIDADPDITDKKVSCVLPPGDYSWYVVAVIMEDDTALTSYKSKVGSFTVKNQIPAPPQVETFPASINAQKAFLSGMVTNRSLEGLETGFYYYKLTAQEGSTELSSSEKERLVMGGKKVLSAGDYKDYFGIDLTDIEQDSKYLFVAYATDEYSQTGKGEVLSFTTGSPSVHVSSVSLNMSSLELGVGNTATLVATVLPENASNKKVTWSSSDESRATVSSQGVVKGISMGNAVITATTEDGGKTAQCHVSVTQSAVHVQSVSLNKTDLVLTVGNSETLVATVLPENAANKSVTWSSSNPSKATVSSTGVVTGVAEGAAVVTATTVDGGKTASCFVTVRQATQPDPGESGNALIELSCDELDWGDVEIGNNVTKTFTVKNTGTTALNISSVSIVATDNTVNPSYFSILPNSSSTVSPGNSLAFNVTFIPEAESGYYAIVSIKSNASNATQGTSTVWLTGVGIKASSSHSVAIPEIIDLGISVKWASFNLGATKPEEYGDYFAWGETEPYYVDGHAYDDPCNDWKEGHSAGYHWLSYQWCNGTETSLTKYCTNSSYGTVDNKCEIELEDDAAHVKLGGNWRMPTVSELAEILNKDNFTWEYVYLKGWKVISKKNGNYIFLPSAGFREGLELRGEGSSAGYYLSSSINQTSPYLAQGIFFRQGAGDPYVSIIKRYLGYPIRPVYDDK